MKQNYVSTQFLQSSLHRKGPQKGPGSPQNHLGAKKSLEKPQRIYKTLKIPKFWKSLKDRDNLKIS